MTSSAATNWLSSTLVDDLYGRLSIKGSVRLASANPHPLSGLGSIDGADLAEGDDILLLAQAAGSQNGIWKSSTGAWSRRSDTKKGGLLGSLVRVREGSTYGGTLFFLDNTSEPVVDSDVQTWSQFAPSGGGSSTPSGSLLPVAFATEAPLPSNAYDGSAGTITASSNGALSVNGANPAANARVLIKNEATSSHNGVYDVIAAGDGSSPFVLRRSEGASLAELVQALQVPVQGGSQRGTWVVATTSPLRFIKQSDVYNVQQFGAVGDNSTDDTAAIQAAENALPAAGGTLHFPDTGTLYKCASLILWRPTRLKFRRAGLSSTGVAAHLVVPVTNSVATGHSDTETVFLPKAGWDSFHPGPWMTTNTTYVTSVSVTATATTFTLAGLTSGDIGKSICIPGAGPNGDLYGGTIFGVSGTTITVGEAFSTSVVGPMVYGTGASTIEGFPKFGVHRIGQIGGRRFIGTEHGTGFFEGRFGCSDCAATSTTQEPIFIRSSFYYGFVTRFQATNCFGGNRVRDNSETKFVKNVWKLAAPLKFPAAATITAGSRVLTLAGPPAGLPQNGDCVGHTLRIKGAGPSGRNLTATILGVTGTSVSLEVAASTSVSLVDAWYQGFAYLCEGTGHVRYEGDESYLARGNTNPDARVHTTFGSSAGGITSWYGCKSGGERHYVADRDAGAFLELYHPGTAVFGVSGSPWWSTWGVTVDDCRLYGLQPLTALSVTRGSGTATAVLYNANFTGVVALDSEGHGLQVGDNVGFDAGTNVGINGDHIVASVGALVTVGGFILQSISWADAGSALAGTTITSGSNNQTVPTSSGTINVVDASSFGAPTTIAAGSDGAVLPQATVHSAGTLTGYPRQGTFYITTDAGVQQCTYADISGNDFIGCAGGTGTMHTGGAINPAIYVQSTGGNGTYAVGYLAKTGTSFTGCFSLFGTGLMQTGGYVSQVAYGGLVSQLDAAAIRVRSPMSGCKFDNLALYNHPHTFDFTHHQGTLFDGVIDTAHVHQDPTSDLGGHCSIGHVSGVGPVGRKHVLFKGGVSAYFDSAEIQSGMDPQHAVSIQPRTDRASRLLNRIAFANDDTGSRWGYVGCTATTGQIDPFGGTRAVKITRSGANNVNSQTIPPFAVLEGVSLGQIDTTDNPTRSFFKIWAKAGSLNQFLAFAYDGKTGAMPVSRQFNAPADWDRTNPASVLLPIPPGHGKLGIYIVPGTKFAVRGDVTFYGAHIIDELGGGFVDPKGVSICSLALEVQSNMLAHFALTAGSVHLHADGTSGSGLPLPATDRASAYALLNALKAAQNTHRVLVGAGSSQVHLAADTVNVVTAADATSDVTAQALADNLKTQLNAHEQSTVAHTVADVFNAVGLALANGRITIGDDVSVEYQQDILLTGERSIAYRELVPTITNVTAPEADGGIGTGGTVTLLAGSNDLSGVILLNTGTTPGKAVEFQFNFGVEQRGRPTITLTPWSANANFVNNSLFVPPGLIGERIVGSETTAFKVKVTRGGGLAFDASTAVAHEIHYRVTQLVVV